MAIETWEYRIDVSVAPAFYKRDTETFTITRITQPSVSNMSAYSLASTTGSISYGYYAVVWQPTYLQFGSLFNTETIPRDTSNHSLDNINVYNISSSILNISGPTQITVKAPGTTESQNTILLYARNSFTLKIQVENKASVIGVSSVTSTSAYLGKSHSVYLTESIPSNLSCSITWSIPGTSCSETKYLYSGMGVSYILDKNWVNSLQDGVEYVNGLVTVVTNMNGQKLGSVEYPITIYVGNVDAPEVVLTIVQTRDPSIEVLPGKNIQNITGIIATANVSSLNPIVSYGFTTIDQAGTASNNKLTIDKLRASGDYTISVTVTDSKGKKATDSRTITIIPYNKPTLSTPTAMRCIRVLDEESGAYEYRPDSDGTYAVVKASANIAEIDGLDNTLTLKCYIDDSPDFDSPLYEVDLVNGVETVINDEDHPLESEDDASYYIMIVAKDSLGNESVYKMALSSASYSIHVRNGGLGVAIGQMSDGGSMFQIADSWTPYWGVYMMPRIIVQAGDSEPMPAPGLIWLKPRS